MYKAITDIGDFKKGDIVPDELAIVWDKQYRYSPVKKLSIDDDILSKPEQIIDNSNAMEDDYLNRNKHVVKKNLENDSFDKETLNRLLKLEKANKNRSSIINVLESKVRVILG